ncbi:transcription termination/antitermination protein NusG [Sulfitobacter sp. CS16]|uniref:transcription termination/antitermination protein NusG n=1 Tax=Sulfitobacter sp. CS16 TaxID=3368573 RepID=UPI00374524D1
MTKLKIGDPWPFRSVRGLTGRPLSKPKWHALVVAPQQEAKAAETLRGAGVEVLYPTVERVRHIRGKRYNFTAPMISQIIYAKFEFAPQWDVMRQRRVITGVFSLGGYPVNVREADVMRMMGLPTEVDRQEAARIASLTPDVGERVTLNGGPLSGFCVDVVRSEMGRVWYRGISAIGRIEGEASVEAIQRIAQ